VKNRSSDKSLALLTIFGEHSGRFQAKLRKNMYCESLALFSIFMEHSGRFQAKIRKKSKYVLDLF
jgi:hypothetical protein